MTNKYKTDRNRLLEDTGPNTEIVSMNAFYPKSVLIAARFTFSTSAQVHIAQELEVLCFDTRSLVIFCSPEIAKLSVSPESVD